MKLTDNNSGRLDILGNRNVLPATEPVATSRFLQNTTGYLSVLAGVSMIALGQSQNVLASNDTTVKIPAGVAQRAAAALADLNSKCSTPELLRRQTQYKLPHQLTRYNFVDVLAGGDNCPGLTVPGGVYTTGAPYTDSGDTTGANNTVGTINACSDYTTVAGPDLIYGFKLSSIGPGASITLSNAAAGYDAAIYVLNGTTGALCPAGPGASVTNCIVGHDFTFGGGGNETISTGEMSTLPLNTQLYLFIDSFYSVTNPLGHGTYTITFSDVTVPGSGPVQNYIDYNGDGKSDYSVVRNTGGGPSGAITWFTKLNGDGPTTFKGTLWGIATDFFVPGDYDGDNKTDIAVWRPGAPFVAAYYVLRSSDNTAVVTPFGVSGDDPRIVGDYTGDGKDDIAVYRAGANAGDASHWWYLASSGPRAGTLVDTQWGQNGDFPAPGDYNGDGKADFDIQRNAGGGVAAFWFHPGVGGTDVAGTNTITLFGTPTDVIVPGDYDGDGKTDLATIRGLAGAIVWNVHQSSGGDTSTIWGASATDFPTQGDYDGDGKTDLAVWRPNADPTLTAFWIRGSTAGPSVNVFGANGDYPVANYNAH